MIRTVLRIGWLNLKRDRVALGLTFVLPIVFFSIFALIFGSMSGGETMSRLRIAAVDADGSEPSRRLLEALAQDSGLRVLRAPRDRPEPYTRDEVQKLVREGDLAAAVVVPAGFGEAFGRFTGERVAVELLHDQGNPVASQIVAGLLQKAAMTAAPDLLMARGVEMLETHGEALTPRQRDAVDEAARAMRGQAAEPGEAAEGFGGIVPVQTVAISSDERGEAKSMAAFYAAGTGVMFLLFSMAGGGGALLEEQESGALDRLLMSSIGMGRLLLGKWLFLSTIGAVQVGLMFCWGALVFGVELFTAPHLAGFLAMTVTTACAAAGFGILLATLSRTRAQLGGISTIVILVMSAVGGSMFPRFLMPDLMKKLGLATFNGWALDGYLKVFWYDDPGAGPALAVARLWPQLLVLSLLAVVFLALARLLARRWEAA